MSTFYEQARDFATRAHGAQAYGRTGVPYTFHLQYVEWVLRRFLYTEDAVLGLGWLHDVVEDCPSVLDTWSTGDGPVLERTIEPGRSDVLHLTMEVQTALRLLTDPPGRNRETRKWANYARWGQEHSKDVLELAAKVKYADRIANVECSLRDAPEIVTMYRKELTQFNRVVATHAPSSMVSHLLGLLT